MFIAAVRFVLSFSAGILAGAPNAWGVLTPPFDPAAVGTLSILRGGWTFFVRVWCTRRLDIRQGLQSLLMRGDSLLGVESQQEVEG